MTRAPSSPSSAVGRETVQQVIAGALLVLAAGFIVWQVRQGFGRNNVTLDWSIFGKPSQLTGGTYLTTILIGMWLTVRLALTSIVLALLLGTVVGVSRLSANPVVRGAAGVYVEFFRNTPLLVQIFFWNFGVLNVLPQGVKTWLNGHSPEQWAVIAALSVYTSSYIAETIRAGIQSIPHGQTEAAQSLGLSGTDTLTRVILPQAFRVVLPPLGSQFLNLTKNSSLASQIGVAELFYYGTQVQSYTFRGFESITAITVAYLILSLAITGLLNLVMHRLRLPGVRP
ncbi:amino acid ABC transporter permease [Deinococcus hopiensis]|uniref:Polar amino acid transport system permease protein n=1 Tax=Deinococcus hopiensis KR-140 TaxID=695939 RepID=A0A1W1VI71_9DEIO|nr:amino acid ABC transporter permease [Deinococcus hopiensis]SMB93052.1 polar amino acid transport system permease protein [Deinococcus hopiensis KR-140]